MELRLTETAKEDIRFFVKSGQNGIVKKIGQLLTSIKETPLSGIGKPEPLKHEYAGKWSRRINGEHRAIYKIEDDIIFIYSLRGHYK